MMIASGLQVSGSDRQDSKYLQSLAAQGARVYVGHRAEQLGDARTVVASSAIREDNPELAEARRRGLRVLHRSAALGSLMLGRRGVAVAGTHGKTTTTAMISSVLSGCGFDPSFVIGGALTGSSTGGHLGGGDVMVVEADESDGSFLQYPAEVAVVTNVDPDHLSNWGTAENYADGFLRFATGERVALLVISADDPGAVELTRRVRDARPPGPHGDHLRRVRRTPTCGSSTRRSPGPGRAFQLRQAGRGGSVAMSVPGHYNVLNAAAAYAVATWLGADEAAVRRQLSGVRRHLPAIPTGRHRRRHPGLRRLRPPPDRGAEHADRGPDRRRGGPGRRLLPAASLHPYSRLLGRAGSGARDRGRSDRDGCLRRPGGSDRRASTVRSVADAVRPGTAHVTYVPGWDDAAPTVAGIARPGDLVITVGCGDVTKVAPLIVAELEHRGEPEAGGA